MWGWVTAALSFTTENSSTIKDIASVASSASSAYASYQQVEYAEKTADMQKDEARRQQQLATYSAQRQARARKAQLLAQQGNAGAFLSTTSSSLSAIDTSLSAGLDELGASTEFNIGQFDIQASNVKNEAMTNIVTSTFSAAIPAMNTADTLLN